MHPSKSRQSSRGQAYPLESNLGILLVSSQHLVAVGTLLWTWHILWSVAFIGLSTGSGFHLEENSCYCVYLNCKCFFRSKCFFSKSGDDRCWIIWQVVKFWQWSTSTVPLVLAWNGKSIVLLTVNSSLEMWSLVNCDNVIISISQLLCARVLLCLIDIKYV